MKLKKKWKIIFLVILIIATLFILLRYIGNMGIKVKEYKIINNNIGNFYGLKIVHVTDLHYGMTNEKKLKKLVKEINLTKPDIVLFTGDLVDKNTEYNIPQISKECEPFSPHSFSLCIFFAAVQKRPP